MKNYSNSISIGAVGDIMPGISSIKALAEGPTIPEIIRNEPDTIFEDIYRELNNCELLLGNLECPLTASFPFDNPSEAPFCLGPDEIVELLKETGFDGLTLANNHILDHGESAVKHTLDTLSTLNLDYIGNPLETRQWSEYTISDRTIRVYGFNLCNQGDTDDLSKIMNEINSVEGPDITLVMLHWGWGYEHLPYPNNEQIAIGHKLIEAGADIIVGSHSHVFQPIEQYKDGIIAYSLGNFLFDMWRSENTTTGILMIIHDENGNLEPVVHPVRIETGRVKQFNWDTGTIVVDGPPSPPDTLELRRKMRNTKHIFEILSHYLRYSHRLPLSFHKSNARRWSQKVTQLREIMA